MEMRKVFPRVFFIFCLVFLTQTIFAQNKSSNNNKVEPKLFDTYSEKSDYSEALLTAYADRFAKALKESPETTKGVIIYYMHIEESACLKEIPTAEKRYNFVRKNLIEKHKTSSDRISSIFGMRRESTELEFWLVPKDAESPTPSEFIIPHYMCGELTIIGAKQVDSKTQFIYFAAAVNGADAIEYKWTISAGKIVEGQGTSQIKVDISGVTIEEITATFEAQDKCSVVCSFKDSFTTKVIP